MWLNRPIFCVKFGSTACCGISLARLIETLSSEHPSGPRGPGGTHCHISPDDFHLNVACDGDIDKKAVLPQGNRAMPQVFFSVEVRQQHSLQV